MKEQIYHVQEYKITFYHDEWSVSTTVYHENTTLYTPQEIWEGALYMLHDDIRKVVEELFTIKDMNIETLTLRP